MNAIDRKKLGEFPNALDFAVTEKFGIECESSFDFFGNFNYVTKFGDCDEQKKKEVEAFIAGFMTGNKELADRLQSNLPPAD